METINQKLMSLQASFEPLVDHLLDLEHALHQGEDFDEKMEIMAIKDNLHSIMKHVETLIHTGA